MNELTDIGTFLINATMQGGMSSFSFTMMRAFNSLRCMVANLGNNFWNMLGFLWYMAKEFGQE